MPENATSPDRAARRKDERSDHPGHSGGLLSGAGGKRYQGLWVLSGHREGNREFLGWFHFQPRKGAAPGETELGYRVRKSAWGNGYATEGSRALIRKGFTEYDVQRVVAEAMAVNQASRRVMEKGGPDDGADLPSALALPIDGDQFGVVEYALDKTGWQQDIASGSSA